ncbi:MAG: helix-turn-helix domain-containing protein [Clostridia bacterium]|nr:helix-turn-helix domain-containing protein [Clostridia bacterium]MBO7404474.1 helix-turn-helix domain-containing protein [Clostridia bacterium]
MNRIKQLRKEKSISQVKLAEVLGVHQTAISQWETGRTNPDLDTAKKLAAYFNVTLDYLLAGEEFRNPALPTAEATSEERAGMLPAARRRYPLLGDIACGEPIFADEDRDSYVDVIADIEADFCLRAKGDSMINARICDGDLVFIKQVPMVENGDIAAVIIGGEATLKRVYYYPERNKLVLAPENSRYEPFVYIGMELEEVRILGKAVAFQSTVR